MAQRLLEGENVIDVDVRDGASADELRQLRQENRKLDEALRTVKNELGQATADKENLERSIRALRNQLAPLHRFMRALFGEIELAIGEEEVTATMGAPGATASVTSSNGDPRWQSFKETFPGVPSRIIDALLAHREMSITQLATFLRAHYNTVSGALGQLSKAGAVSKDGGKNGKYRLNS
jgi:hypothetical protein